MFPSISSQNHTFQTQNRFKLNALLYYENTVIKEGFKKLFLIILVILDLMIGKFTKIVRKTHICK